MAGFSGRLRDAWNAILGFAWQGRAEQTPPANIGNTRPGNVDREGGLTANSEMLKALYEGTYQGLQFASPLVFPPVATIVALMGIPVPKSDDPQTQKTLDEITAQMQDKFCKLHRRSLLHGTAWRFPRYDQGHGLVWEEIPDTVVADILVDIASNRIKEIYTSEQIKVRARENVSETLQRNHHFLPDRISVKYNIGRYADYAARNVAGVLPIPFSNETDESEIRGHSMFSRVLRDLKDYHDIDYRVSTILAKFSPKMVQQVGDATQWALTNANTKNVREAFASMDIFSKDLVVNLADKEAASFVFAPSDATTAHESALRRKFLKIVEGTGIPELFWGPLATGNHATTEEQWQQAINRVEEIRTQYAESYQKLYRGSLNVLGVANARRYAGDITIGWNRLNAVSQKTRADILRSFSSAVGAMASSGTMTLRQLYTLWNQMNPDSGIGAFEEFKGELLECVDYMRKVNADPYYRADADTGDAEGEDDQ